MTVAQIAALERIELKAGAHDSPDDGMCVMEAVAYFAGEPFSDQPQCVSPVIGAFLRSWNDSLDDSSRQRLKAYVFRVMGTNTGASNEEQRAWLAIDWLVRTYAPTWFDLAGLNDYASALRDLPELTTNDLAEQAQETIEAAWDAAKAAAWDTAKAADWNAAWDAAWAAAWDAAKAAAWNAAWDAAKAAAWDAAWDAAKAAAWDTAKAAAWNAAWDAAKAAAWDAAWDAAWNAAWDAAKAAAWDAAWNATRVAAAKSALRPTVEALQASAFDLLDRMIAVGNERAEIAER